MKAVRLHSYDEWPSIDEVPEPEITGPLDVIVRIGGAGLCRTDLHIWEGQWAPTTHIELPYTIGHENAGWVHAVGTAVTNMAVGDAVIVHPKITCGLCRPCRDGDDMHCEDGAFPGIDTDGGWAELLRTSARSVVKLPDGIHPADVAAHADAGLTAYHAVKTAVLRGLLLPGTTVVVIGAGGVGLNAIQGARLAGAARVIAVDMTEDKLAAARDFGATDGVLATDPKPWRAARAAAGGRAADAVLVTVGAIPAYDAAQRYLAPRGRLVMVGMPHSGEKAGYEPVVVAAQGQALVGSMMGEVVLSRDIPWMVDLWRQGRLELAGLISGRWSLEHINEAFADTRAGHARRNVIVLQS